MAYNYKICPEHFTLYTVMYVKLHVTMAETFGLNRKQ